MKPVTELPDWDTVLREAGLDPDPAAARRLDALAVWMAERASPLGLTNYRSPYAVAARAIVPTLALFRLLRPPPGTTLADLGAGSGVAGLTLAILLPQARITLIDRRHRAMRFVRLTAARLGQENVECREESAQSAAKRLRSAYDLVCFRALAPGAAALDLARPLLGEHGRVAAWHQAADAAYLEPSDTWERVGTVGTALDRLAVSLYRVKS